MYLVIFDSLTESLLTGRGAHGSDLSGSGVSGSGFSGFGFGNLDTESDRSIFGFIHFRIFGFRVCRVGFGRVRVEKRPFSGLWHFLQKYHSLTLFFSKIPFF